MVDCRRPTTKEKKWRIRKRKEGQHELDEWTNASPSAGEMRQECLINKINKKSRLTVKFYGQYTYQNVTACTILVNCTIPSLTRRHPTFGFAFLASLTVFHPSTDIKLWSESVRACQSRFLRGESSNLENKKRRKKLRQLLVLLGTVVRTTLSYVSRLHVHSF